MKGPSPMRKTLVAVAAVAAAVPVLLTGASARATTSHSLIQGSGSSWSSNAVNQWIADVEPTGLQVVFTASGSAQGRKDFAYKTTDFAVSDIGYLGQDPVTGEQDTSQGRAFAYLPIVAGGTAFPYQVKAGGKLVRNIRLTGSTLAKIFTLQITNWNDAAITKDNNGRVLPSLPIIPVVHSEGSGSTAQFTRYLDHQYPAVWRPFFGRSGSTEYYPSKSGLIAQNGSDGVMNFVASAAANGSIGYDEYSYALAKNYPVVKLGNVGGYFTAPTQYNVAVALTQAKINTDKDPSHCAALGFSTSPCYLLQTLDKVYVDPDKRAYPMSSYSYMLIPTASDDARMTTAKRQTIADFLNYSICEGQAEMGPIGYSPLPINLAQASFDQVTRLHTADPAVDTSHSAVTQCNNPTFVKGQPKRNYLAEIAPAPAPCDKQGAGPCADGVGLTTSNPGHTGGGTSGGTTGGGSTTGSAGSSGASATSGGAPTTPSAGTTGAPAAGATTSGLTSGAVTTGAAADVTATATVLSADQGMSPTLAVFAVALLLAVIVAPPLLAQRLGGKRP